MFTKIKANKSRLSVIIIMSMVLLMACSNKREDIDNEQSIQATETTSENEQNIDLSAYKLSPSESYGRVIFLGDSRTVDTFSEEYQYVEHLNVNGVIVYAMDCVGYDYMPQIIDEYGLDNFDTLIVWLGCNDDGVFEPYGKYYENLISQGKKLVICNVGPTENSYLPEECMHDYTNEAMIRYNDSLNEWASTHEVQIIDMYTFALNNLTINPDDGTHYVPRPTVAVWDEIMSHLQ